MFNEDLSVYNVSIALLRLLKEIYFPFVSERDEITKLLRLAVAKPWEI